MDDLISRQAAIDAVNKIAPVNTEYDCTLLDRLDVRYVLTELPSAQPELPIKRKCTVCPHCSNCDVNDDGTVKTAEPERKKGKWIDYTDEGYVVCPFCHNATNCDGNKDELHYCFSCGAELRGDRK